MTPPIAAARSASAMTSMSGVERRARRRRACACVSPGRGAADDERPAGQPLEVERVHRLAELEHHVVGDVDDVVDRADAGGLEPLGSQAGDGPMRDLEHLRAVARAEVGVLDGDVERLAAGPAGPASRSVRQLQRQRPRSPTPRARADHAQAVGPVRGDLEVDHRLAAVLDRRDLEAAQR